MRISKYCIYEIVLFHFFLLFYVFSFTRKDSWEISFILLFFVLLLLILEYCRTRLFVSPMFFWFTFWLGAIVIGRMNLGIKVYPLYREWTKELLVIVLLNTFVFFWFYWLGECLVFRQKAEEKQRSEINGEKLANVIIAFLIIASSAFIVNIIKTGVVPQLTGNANAYRSSFVATRYYKVVSVLRFSIACVPLAYKNTSSKEKRIFLLFISGVYIFEEMLSGWRGYTLQAMILLLTSFFLSSDVSLSKVRRKNILIAFCTVLFLTLFIFIVTITRDGSFEKFESRIKYAVENYYMYIAPNFLNFQSAVEKVQPKGFFMYSLEAIWGIFISAAENPQFVWYDVEYSIGAYNVSTYLLEPYCDLGVLGTVVWSGFIAAVSGKAYGEYKKNNSIAVTVLIGIMNIAIFFFHNNFFLRSSSVVLWIAAGYLLGTITKRRPFVND